MKKILVAVVLSLVVITACAEPVAAPPEQQRAVCDPIFRGNQCQYAGPWWVDESQGLRGPFPGEPGYTPPTTYGGLGGSGIPQEDLVCIVWDWIKKVCLQWGGKR